MKTKLIITEKIETAFSLFIQMPDKESRKMISEIAMQGMNIKEQIAFSKIIINYLKNVYNQTKIQIS
jgi:hypothetical protein